MLQIFLSVILLFMCSSNALAQTRCIDGTYVSGGCVLTPSGRYIGGGITTSKPSRENLKDKPQQQRVDERDARQQNNDIDRENEREGLTGDNSSGRH